MAHPDEGRRVRLIHCSDPWTRIEPGTEGEVKFVDDVGTYHVKWDNGSSLGLIPGQDRWELIDEFDVLVSKAMDAQKVWVEDNVGVEAWKTANVQGIDEANRRIDTKVYGHGRLVTYVDSLDHEWMPFDEESVV